MTAKDKKRTKKSFDVEAAFVSSRLRMIEDQSSSFHPEDPATSTSTRTNQIEDVARSILDSIEPLPPPSRTSSRGSSNPGAFLTDSSGREQEARKVPFNLLTSNNANSCSDRSLDCATQQPQLMQQQSETEDTTSRRREEEGAILPLAGERLSVANLIDDDPVDLPQAQEYDPESNTTRTSIKSSSDTSNDSRSKIMCFIVVVLVLVTINVVTLALTVWSPDETISGTASDIDQVTSDVPASNISTHPHQTHQSHVLGLLPKDTVQIIQLSDTSPQAMAYDWLITDPFLDEYSDARIVQRFVLATLWYSTNGFGWLHRTNWMSYHHHECTWWSQTSFAAKETWNQNSLPGYLEDFQYGQTPCNATYDKDLYQNLWLDQNMLLGTIPTELYLLTHLKTLSLGLNGLKGGIPTNVGQLTNLEGLTYFYMNLGGTMPSQIGLLTNLKVLGLAKLGLTGTIPTEVRLLTNLETLSLTEFRTPGPLPELQLYTSLKWAILDECGFTGTIPTEIGLLKQFEFAAFGGNSLSGTVPTQVGLLTNMLMLSTYSNELTGALPTELGELTSSTLISFRGNKLSGSLPTELGLNSKLTSLNLQQNRFSGTIPSQLGNLESLYELSLMENRMTGKLPSELGQLTSLGRFSAHDNPIRGIIPREMTSMLSSGLLYTFDVANTSLSGTVPEEFCGLNGTCLSSMLNPCEKRQGLIFDCSSVLCGCDCPCAAEDSNSSAFTTIPFQ